MIPYHSVMSKWQKIKTWVFVKVIDVVGEEPARWLTRVVLSLCGYFLQLLMVYLVCTYILDTFKPSDLTNKQVWFLPFFIMLMFLWDVICFVSMKVSVLIVMFVAGIDDCSLPMHLHAWHCWSTDKQTSSLVFARFHDVGIMWFLMLWLMALW